MIASTVLEKDLFFANRIEKGWTWTLASRLGEMLRLAEKKYGPRDKSWTILGIEFGDNVPRVWYPGNCKNVIVQLTPSAAIDKTKACYQLAHESIHLLAPTGGEKANVFEEGLATHFSHEYLEEKLGVKWECGMDSYARARQLLLRLFTFYPDAVLRVRERHPTMWTLAPEDILTACPDVPTELAEGLCGRFVR